MGLRIPFIKTEEEKLNQEHAELMRQKNILDLKIRNRKVMKDILAKQKELQDVK